MVSLLAGQDPPSDVAGSLAPQDTAEIVSRLLGRTGKNSDLPGPQSGLDQRGVAADRSRLHGVRQFGSALSQLPHFVLLLVYLPLPTGHVVSPCSPDRKSTRL